MSARSGDNRVQDVARRCIDTAEPAAKVAAARELARRWRAGELRVEHHPAEPIAQPGRPVRPRLVDPGRVPRRNLRSERGRAALVHALAHIEFNAIDLACDAVYRFGDMPAAFYGDWIRVADEEARHFTLLVDRLQRLGHAYGDFDAHNGLWEMACATAGDALVRMALVPRVLEARGLDVTPGMIERLQAVGDQDTVAVLEIILREEVGHVAIGSRWFYDLCDRRGLAPEATFAELLRRHMSGRIKGPFHDQARIRAGFTQSELYELKRQAGIAI